MNIHKISNYLFALIAAGVLTGCASTKVTMDSMYGGKLTKPNEILVYNFAVSPDEVTLDSGISGKLQSMTSSTPRTDEERAVGRKCADALSNHLVTEIQKLGFTVNRAYSNTQTNSNTLSIKGAFLSINEGNQAERVVIGLGMGRTDVRTLVQAYDINDGKTILATEFGVNARSGSSPGMAETMGVGALTGHLVTSAVVSTGVQVGTEAFSANVEADADRTAKAIANQLKTYFLSQGWIQ
jgi:hypothetical protein